MDTKQFNKALVTIKKGASRFTLIHDAAMFAAEQINKHGQTTPANQLLSVMHKADRVEALRVWFNDFTKANNTKEGTLKYSDKKELAWDGEPIGADAILDIADGLPYYEYSHEIKPASTYDIQKAVAQILKRAAKFKNDGKNVEHEELIEKLRSFVPAA